VTILFSSNNVFVDTAFRQQRLKAWQPLLTPGPVIIAFVVIGVIFIPVGVILLITSNNVRCLKTKNRDHKKCRNRKMYVSEE
jgi:hypothetical protein